MNQEVVQAGYEGQPGVTDECITPESAALFGTFSDIPLVVLLALNTLEIKDREIERLGEEVEASSRRVRFLEELVVRKVEGFKHWAKGVRHDIGNIITPIPGNAQLAARYLKKLEAQGFQGGEFSKIIELNEGIIVRSGRLTSFVGELEFEEYGRNRVVVSVGAFLETIIEKIRPSLKPGRIIDVVEFPGKDPRVMINIPEIERVADNLIDNAVKYSPDGGNVEVLVRVSDDGSKVLFSVKDNGKGIDPAYLDRVFEEDFRTPDAIQSGIMGSGVGLKVARDIVEAHGGKIWAESEGEGEGSTFHFTLPVVSSTESSN